MVLSPPPPPYIEPSNENTPMEFEEFEYFSFYEVNGDDIVLAETEPGQDHAKQEEVWNFFVDLVPTEWRGYISHYFIFSDGPGGTLAAVYRNIDNLNKFVLIIDLDDAFTGGSLNEDTLRYILFHEFSHVISLNSDQIQVNNGMYMAETMEEFLLMRDIARNLCPNFFTFDGCSFDSSYINQYMDEFWTDQMFEDIWAIQEVEDVDTRDSMFVDYYYDNSSLFVSAYAVTDPDEDIAESLAYFFMNDTPPNDILTRNKKILFFYDYPELVVLRDAIKESL